MTTRKAHLGLAIMLAFLSLVAVVLGHQREVYAEENQVPPVPVSPCGDIFPYIPGMPGCDGEGGDGGNVPPVPVDPCEDIFPGIPNMPQECEEETDVCPNIEGTQTSVPEGKVLTDGICVDAGGGNTGTGSGGSGSGSGGGGGGGGGGSVLGTSTPAYLEGITSCDMYLTDFLKKGGQNAVEQVQRLQDVLQKDGLEVEVSGVFDDNTHSAVLAFQTKYASSILTPWGLSEPTGFVYLTTRKQVNEIYCEGKEFPLSSDEQSIVNGSVGGSVAGAARAAVTPTKAEAPKPVMEVEVPETMEQKTEESAVSMPSNRISNFFRRLFDRFW